MFYSRSAVSFICVTCLDCSQIAVDDAEHLMNCVAAGESTWDDVRADVAAHYARAGFEDAAAFIRAAVQ